MSTDILAIGGSYGSYRLLSRIIQELPEDYKDPMVAALHLGSQVRSHQMSALLSGLSNRKVRMATMGDRLQSSLVILAPADYHLLVEAEGSLTLNRDEPVNYCRPSIDVLFESLMYWKHGQVTAVLLSGANEDGAKGLRDLENGGARIIIQDPSTAQAPRMPEAGIQLTERPMVVPPEKIVACIVG